MIVEIEKFTEKQKENLKEIFSILDYSNHYIAYGYGIGALYFNEEWVNFPIYFGSLSSGKTSYLNNLFTQLYGKPFKTTNIFNYFKNNEIIYKINLSPINKEDKINTDLSINSIVLTKTNIQYVDNYFELLQTKKIKVSKFTYVYNTINDILTYTKLGFDVSESILDIIRFISEHQYNDLYINEINYPLLEEENKEKNTIKTIKYIESLPVVINEDLDKKYNEYLIKLACIKL